MISTVLQADRLYADRLYLDRFCPDMFCTFVLIVMSNNTWQINIAKSVGTAKRAHKASVAVQSHCPRIRIQSSG